MKLERAENVRILSRYGNYNGTVSVENNHILVTGNGGTEWFWDVNVSSITSYGQDVSNVKKPLFKISSDSTVKLCCKNLTGSNISTLRLALGAWSTIHDTNQIITNGVIQSGKEELTVKVDKNMDVPCITLSMLCTDKTKKCVAEMDIEVYVDGDRII